jgi:hypothetical protein
VSERRLGRVAARWAVRWPRLAPLLDRGCRPNHNAGACCRLSKPLGSSRAFVHKRPVHSATTVNVASPRYCGGTEIGGGYLTGTLLQPQAPSAFSTPTLGASLVLLGPEGGQSPHEGGTPCIGCAPPLKQSALGFPWPPLSPYLDMLVGGSGWHHGQPRLAPW